MKKFLSILFATALVFTTSACGENENVEDTGDKEEEKEELKWVDYTSDLTLTKDYEGKSFKNDGIGEVELFRNVDGDTAHFVEKGQTQHFSLRFLGVNTPESTGKIEEWGKAASNFTADKLNNATTIVLESETGGKPSMTGDRYLGWVWVDGKLLSVEIVQAGFSGYSSVSGSSYNQTLLAADFQAQAFKLKIWSGLADPDFYYGEAEHVTLKEIRENILEYNGKKVCFTGTVTRKEASNAYLEYTEEGESYGMYVFTQYSSVIANVLAVGTEVQITGQISYHDYNGGTPEEGNGAFQLVDVKYSPYFPTEDDIKVITSGNEVTPTVVTALDLNATTNKTIENTFVKLNDLTCVDGYTESDGDMTINCVDSSGNKVNLRINKSTVRDQEGNLITTHEYFLNKNIDASGIVTKYNGSYQVLLTLGSDINYLN